MSKKFDDLNIVRDDDRFLALIIPRKDWDVFFRKEPKFLDSFNRLCVKYCRFRKLSGRVPVNRYIIVNQDESYAGKLWEVILAGEREKLHKTELK